MTNETQHLGNDGIPSTTNNVIHTMMQFLSLLRRRRSYVIAAIGACLILGLIYFASSTRSYQAKAQILIRKSQTDSSSVQMMADRNTQDQMATFERLLKSTVVLERALAMLDSLPPEIPRSSTLEKAVEDLSDMLYAKAIRRTSILELTCRSEDPDATVGIVNAVVASYLQYMDENHKSVSAEVVTLLKGERKELERQLLDSERQLVLAKHQSSELGLDGDSGYVHPAIQSVITLNDAVLERRQRRVQLQATLTALERTVANGGDLRQHMLSLEPLIGRDLLLSAIGLNPHDTEVLSKLEETNVDNQGKLRALAMHYGPNHPKIQKLKETIDASNNYATTFQTRLQERVDGMQSAELGNMLLTLVKEDLASTVAQEQRLMQEYNGSQAAAKDLITSRSEITIMEREVESLRELKSTLISRIGHLEINQSQADVRVSMVSHPRRPMEPISPELPKVVLMSLLLGTLIGTGIVYVLDAIDDKFRSPEELQEQLGIPVLAMIRKHEIREGTGLGTLLVHHSPNAVESEAFRTLRTTLAFSGHDCSRLVVSSSEPSDGKTTVLANLGVSATQSGKRTLMIDCDLRRPGLTNLFELRRAEGVAEILRSTEEIGAMAHGSVINSGMPGLDILASGRRPSDPAELLSRDRFEELIAWAETEYDQILIDSPPVLAAADASIIGRLVDGMMVVIQPQKNHRRSVIRAFESLYRMGINVLGVVVNAVDQDESNYGGYGGYGYGYGAGYGTDEDADDMDFDEPLPIYPLPAAANRPGVPTMPAMPEIPTAPIVPAAQQMNAGYVPPPISAQSIQAIQPAQAMSSIAASGAATISSLAAASTPESYPVATTTEAGTQATRETTTQPANIAIHQPQRVEDAIAAVTHPPEETIPEKTPAAEELTPANLNEGGSVTIRRRA